MGRLEVGPRRSGSSFAADVEDEVCFWTVTYPYAISAAYAHTRSGLPHAFKRSRGLRCSLIVSEIGPNQQIVWYLERSYMRAG